MAAKCDVLVSGAQRAPAGTDGLRAADIHQRHVDPEPGIVADGSRREQFDGPAACLRLDHGVKLLTHDHRSGKAPPAPRETAATAQVEDRADHESCPNQNHGQRRQATTQRYPASSSSRMTRRDTVVTYTSRKPPSRITTWMPACLA